jgi:thymidylate synthase (FAD)
MIFLEPRITVLARPSFAEPSHLPVNWLGESTDGERLAEFAGRLCYMSQKNPASRATREYLENIKKQGHGSVLEHANYSLLLEGISRSLTHELVRHRAGFAYSQLSQRYVDESEANFVMPPAIIGDEALESAWRDQVESAQASYVALVEKLMGRYAWVQDKVHRRKMAREAARGVLPNSTENNARAAVIGRRGVRDKALRDRDHPHSLERSASVLFGLRGLSGWRSRGSRKDRVPQGLVFEVAGETKSALATSPLHTQIGVRIKVFHFKPLGDCP